LISTGTAICGGSAIAALGPISGATDEQMAVSLGAVFVLNALALLIFPVVGTALRLTQTQFGLGLLWRSTTPVPLWGGRKVRGRGSSGGHHGQTGPRALDCSPVHRDGGDKRRQGKDSMAMVYRFLLPGGSV